MKRKINQKRPYVRPAMQVYELPEPGRLLQTSNEDYSRRSPLTW